MKRRELKLVATARHSLEGLDSEADPLRRLVAIGTAMNALEHLERTNVDQARAAGRTWAEIGALYGLTKQGAQQRFRGTRAHRPHH